VERPIQPVKAVRYGHATFGVKAPDASDVQPVQAVLGDGTKLPQDVYEPQDPDAEFPTLDVITLRILKTMHRVLDIAAEEAARKPEAETQPAPEPDQKQDTVQRPTMHVPGSGDPQNEEHPVIEHLLGAAGRIERQLNGEALLGEAKAALSQATHNDLVAVHQLESPTRLFAS